MNKIKVIKLLNKIANGEEVPKKIRYLEQVFTYNEIKKDYICNSGYYNNRGFIYYFILDGCKLKLEVEIIEEDKEIEFEDIESFGIHYSWDYIDYKNIEELKKYTNKDFQEIFDTLDKLIRNQKKLIDVVNKLNKKGE